MTSPELGELTLPSEPVVTRFAPSPTGYLHLGHAFAALTAFELAQRTGGRFLLRIEDIDGARCRDSFTGGILEDLTWLGLSWETPIRRQSGHMADYAAALAQLDADGLTYPCFCTRKDIAEAAAAPQGPTGPLYPGTCRALDQIEQRERITSGTPFVLRLDMAQAIARAQSPIVFEELGRGPAGETGTIVADPTSHGDVVLARKDVPASYHLCVTLDDALQGVTLVTRGEDLFAATAVQRLLQTLLGLPAPVYFHHRLICDLAGRRLAKRDRDQTLESLRADGATPAMIRAQLNF